MVEELTRTNLPHRFLLTIDPSISKNVLIQMRRQNITVVNFESVVGTHSAEMTNLISYATLFHERIPLFLQFWSTRENY